MMSKVMYNNVNGLSDYEIARSYGYQGSVEDWIHDQALAGKYAEDARLAQNKAEESALRASQEADRAKREADRAACGSGSGGGDNSGIPPQLSIGSVTTLEPGQSAEASITGSNADLKLNLGIPAGYDGSRGADGGYYTPTVTQPDSSHLKFDFSGSRPDMPPAESAQITLPALSSTDNHSNRTWKLLTRTTFAAPASQLYIDKDADGNPFKCIKAVIIGQVKTDADSTSFCLNNEQGIGFGHIISGFKSVFSTKGPRSYWLKVIADFYKIGCTAVCIAAPYNDDLDAYGSNIPFNSIGSARIPTSEIFPNGYCDKLSVNYWLKGHTGVWDTGTKFEIWGLCIE